MTSKPTTSATRKRKRSGNEAGLAAVGANARPEVAAKSGAPAHEARFYEKRAGGAVLCTLCPHDCHIRDGGRGACAVRYNSGGVLYTLVYDRVVARHVDPVEKKPLFHFFPGSHVYSIATVGCNQRCSFCQNWTIAQWPKEHLPASLRSSTASEGPGLICPQFAELGQRVIGEPVTPEAIVSAARATGCDSIAYTYTEPTIFYELACDTAALARQAGLRNIFVTNGFISAEPLRALSGVLDAANVDLKFFNPGSYRRIARARLEPILAAIRLYHEIGVWLEITTLVIPGVNDSDGELTQIAEFIASIDPAIPWHVSQFYPTYKMLDRPATPVATLRRAAAIGRSAGLRYVYEGNVPGEAGESTRCWQCGELLIQRFGSLMRRNRIEDGTCPGCKAKIDGVGMSATT
jgi:pyruvate formate lyase activating enzyme